MINKKLIALIAGGIILIAAIIYFVFIRDYSQGGTAPDANTPPAGNVDTTPEIIETPAPVEAPAAATPESQGREQASRLALSFAERYGTSSSQSDFSNLSDLEIFMTDAFKARTRAYVAAEQAKAAAAAEYSGTITKAVVSNVTTYNESAGTAEVTVSTKRQGIKAGGETTSYSQDLKLSLKRSGTQWLVDSADWVK